jgi:hypothetical protein
MEQSPKVHICGHMGNRQTNGPSRGENHQCLSLIIVLPIRWSNIILCERAAACNHLHFVSICFICLRILRNALKNEPVTERSDSIHLANVDIIAPAGDETDLLASPILSIEREDVIAPEAEPEPEEEQEELQEALPRTHQTRVAEAHGVEWTRAAIKGPPLFQCGHGVLGIWLVR